MIRSVEIAGLRGIREGKLTDLTPLVVLVGPNGCGKSTILEAILLGASPMLGETLMRVVQRHRGVKRGARWVSWKGGDLETASIVVKADDPPASSLSELVIDRAKQADRTSIKQFVDGDPVVTVDFPFNPQHQPFVVAHIQQPF